MAAMPLLAHACTQQVPHHRARIRDVLARLPGAFVGGQELFDLTDRRRLHVPVLDSKDAVQRPVGPPCPRIVQ
eukprot:5310652-Prymnesium_polylepis.2